MRAVAMSRKAGIGTVFSLLCSEWVEAPGSYHNEQRTVRKRAMPTERTPPEDITMGGSGEKSTVFSANLISAADAENRFDSGKGVRLRTKNVFVDANVHIAAKFVYHRGNLTRLAKLADASLAVIFDTLVDRGEITSNIRETAQAAADLLKKFGRTAESLSASTDPAISHLFRDHDVDQLTSLFEEQYDGFRRTARVKSIDVSQAHVSAVFQRYFDRRSPFTEKKRSEFPDAFIVAALSEWCWLHSEFMYVVSADSGFRQAARQMGRGRLIPLERIEEFLDLVVSAESEPAAFAAQAWIDTHGAVVSQAVGEEFKNAGFYVEDADGDVLEVELEGIELGTPLLVEAGGSEAVFDVPFEATFTAEIEYDVPGTGFYDHEDKVMLFQDRARKIVRRTEDYTAEVQLDVGEEELEPAPDDGAKFVIELHSVTIEGSRDLPVSTEDEFVEHLPASHDEESWSEVDDGETEPSEGDSDF